MNSCKLITNKHERNSTGPRSYLFQYFLLVSLIASVSIIIMTTVGLRIIIHNYIVHEAERDAERISVALRDNLLSRLLQERLGQGNGLFVSQEEMEEMDKSCREFLAPFNIVKIKVFAADTQILYSTDLSIIGQFNTTNSKLLSALNGVSVSKYETAEHVWDLAAEQRSDVGLVETYVPIYDSNGRVVGSFEIYKDVTTDLTSVAGTLFLATATTSVIVFGIFIILVFMMYRATAKVNSMTVALQDKTAEMETMLRAVSHDLRAPLVNINGFSGELATACDHITEMLKHVTADEKTQKEIATIAAEDIPDSLNFIRTSAKKMDALLAGLSHLANIGAVKLNIRPLRVNDLVRQVVDAMKFSANEANATIELESLPDCLGDETQINQVFSNLIGNAVKYLAPDRPGHIRISGKLEGDMAQYCVEDNGAGIPERHKSKVFEIFHRVDPHSPVAGEGLGLTTTRRIVERHNGRIRLESKMGCGSKFFISLPTR